MSGGVGAIWGVVAISLALGGAAAAEPDGAGQGDPDHTLAEARAHYARGEYAEARVLLRAAYEATPRPDLLFALGQVEFHLDAFAAAIDYYEQFLATNPEREQAALAQQAIGAARARLAIPPPPPPAPPPPPPVWRHPWTIESTGLTVLGGLAIVVGAGLVYDARRATFDGAGTLGDYELRLDKARTERTFGISAAIGGAVAITATLVRWRLHRERAPTLVPAIAPGGSKAVGVVLEGAW